MESSELLRSLADAFAVEGVTVSRMFGSAALTLDGKVLALVQQDQCVFKLGAGSRHLEEAMALPGAALFEPGGMGRRWKDWVALPLARCEQFPRLLHAAIAVARA